MLETFGALAGGFAVALKPINLLWGFVGVTVGTAVGVLPGVGPALTVAMLLPLTAQLDPTGALIMFAGIYYGAMFGGSTTTILLNTPGESASIATALEGNRMAKRGRAGPALATAAIGSYHALRQQRRLLGANGEHVTELHEAQHREHERLPLRDAGAPRIRLRPERHAGHQ